MPKVNYENYMQFINKEEVYLFVGELIERAEEYYGRNIKAISIDYNLKGTTAGQAQYTRSHISLNPVLFAENYDDYFNTTIPHEVAHILSYEIYGHKGTGHGTYWKSIMSSCFKINPSRCHSYDVSNVKNKTTTYNYTCGCGKKFDISSIRHKRYLNKQTNISSLRCNKCKTQLRFIGE